MSVVKKKYENQTWCPEGQGVTFQVLSGLSSVDMSVFPARTTVATWHHRQQYWTARVGSYCTSIERSSRQTESLKLDLKLKIKGEVNVIWKLDLVHQVRGRARHAFGMSRLLSLSTGVAVNPHPHFGSGCFLKVEKEEDNHFTRLDFQCWMLYTTLIHC